MMILDSGLLFRATLYSLSGVISSALGHVRFRSILFPCDFFSVVAVLA